MWVCACAIVDSFSAGVLAVIWGAGRMAAMEFPNHLLQLQWMSAALGKLETEAKKCGTPLDTKHLLVSPLLEGLLSPSHPTVLACSTVLVSAASHLWVDRSGILTAFVSRAASMKYYPVAVAAIRQLLMVQMEGSLVAGQKKYSCPYSLRTNTHPFITVLNSCPKSGQCIVSEVPQMLRSKQHSSVLQLLEPFVKYVFLHPSPTPELVLIGRQLSGELISTARRLLNNPPPHGNMAAGLVTKDIIQLMVRVLPLLPIRTSEQLESGAVMVTNLVQFVIDSLQSKGVPPALLDSCLSLSCEMTSRGLSIVSILESIESLLLTKLCPAPGAHHIMCLGWLLLRSLLDPQATARLLKICQLVSPGCCFLHLLVFPLVQLLSQPTLPTLQSHDLSLTNQKAALELLQILQQSTEQELNLPPSTAHITTPHYSLLISTARTYQSLPPSLSRTLLWIKQLIDAAAKTSPSGSLDHIVLMMSSLALRLDEEESTLGRLLETFTALAKAEPSTSPSLLPLLLYLHSTTSRPDSKLSLLYSIPSLATHRLATGGVVNTLLVLGENPSLVSIATRLMGRVWQMQDHVFSRLHDLLSRPLPSSLPKEATREIGLARAAVIRDVCCGRAELHGEDMLSLVSHVLSQSHDPIAVAMVTEGLVALCRAEVVDVVTVWSVLGGRLGNDRRTAVVVAVCPLFELASELDLQKQSQKVFKSTGLRHLWSSVFSKNGHICSAALKALSKFHIEDFLVELLPDKVIAMLGLTSPDMSHDPEAVPSLVGCDCVQLVQHLPLASLPEYSLFLTQLLDRELKEVPRGVAYSALRQPMALERELSAIPGKLQGLCASQCARDGSAGLITGTLLSVYEVQQGGTARTPGRQALTETLQQYTTMMKAFLREGRFSVDLSASDGGWLGAFALADQWKQFMGRLLEAYCQVRLLETCPVSVREDTTNPILAEKQTEACSWARGQIVENLLDFVRASGGSGANVLLALVGVVCAKEPFDHVTSSSQSDQCSQGSILVEMMECLIAILSQQDRPIRSLPILGALLQVLQRSSQLQPAAILSVPLLVDGVLTHAGIVPQAIQSRLAVLGDALLAAFNRSPQWYTAVALNHFVAMVIPICNEAKRIANSLTSYLEAALNTEQNESLLAFFPTLCVCPGQQEMITKLLSHIHSTLSTLTPSHDLHSPSIQLSCLHIATTLPDVFLSALLSAEESMQYIVLLANLATKAPSVATYNLSLTVALHGLITAGHPSVLSLADSIAAKWVQEVQDKDSSPNQVLSVLWGLAGMLGVNPLSRLPWRQEGVFPLKFLQTLFPLVAAALEKCSLHPADTVCGASLWLLGHVYHTTAQRMKHYEKVPLSYGYLPETSILSSLHRMLQTLTSHATETPQKEVAKSLLQVLARSEHDLPPADFSSILTPLCRISELQIPCICSAVRRSKDSLGFQQFITHCCNSVVFTSLKLESQCILAENIQSIPNHLLARFLQMLCNLSLRYVLRSQELLSSFLKGLKQALQAKEQTSLHLLAAIVIKLYEQLKIHEECILTVCGEGILHNLAVCMRLSLLHVAGQTPLRVTDVFSCILHCCWVIYGEERFTSSLRPVLEWVFNNTESKVAISWLLKTVRHCCSPDHSKNSLLHQSDLLHNLVTWTRNEKPSCKQMELVLVLTSRAVDPRRPLVPEDMPLVSDSSPFSWEGLCSNMQILLPPESSTMREKLCQCLTEWLGLLEPELQRICLGSLSSMRSTDEYQKPLIWTSIAHVV